jgi:hypothetical protein
VGLDVSVAGRKSCCGEALQRTPEERRYPLLVAFLHQSLADIADVTIDQFDRCLAEAHARAGHDPEEFRSSVAQTTNEMLRLFGDLARLVLDPTVRDAWLRHAIYRQISAERLQKAVRESTRIVRPDEDSGFDFLRRRYGHLRQFIPAYLAAFPFRSHIDPDLLLEAIDLLRFDAPTKLLRCPRMRARNATVGSDDEGTYSPGVRANRLLCRTTVDIQSVPFFPDGIG